MSSPRSSLTSSSEDNSENEGGNPIASRRKRGRQNILGPGSDEDNEPFILLQRRQSMPSPSCSSDSDRDSEELYDRVQAQSMARKRRRREMESEDFSSPTRGQNCQHSDLEQSLLPTNQDLEHPIHDYGNYNHDIPLQGERLSSINGSISSVSDNGIYEDDFDEGSQQETSECSEDDVAEDLFIFDDSNISVNTFNHLLLGLAEKHSLSGKVQSDLLDLFNIMLPEDNNVPKSLYLYNKIINHVNYAMKNYVVCSSCQEEISINNPVCSNGDCQDFELAVQPLEFAIIDILPQLQRVLTGNWPAIEENLDRITNGHVSSRYEDVTDGHVYRTEVPQNPDKNNVVVTSLVWHIDGAAAVKSKDLKLWPIFAIIIEVPKDIRYSFYNVLFCGLWHGKKNPAFALFQKHFVEQVKMLMTGFTINLPDHDIACRLRIQGQLADLPAKAASLNFKQFNGQFGCSVCLDPGAMDEANPLQRYHPYRTQKAPLRNHDDTVQHAYLANNGREPVFGVKGPSPVHSILTVPGKLLFDYLHQVLEGEYFRKLKSWFVTSNPQDAYCLKSVLCEFDKLILSVKLPHDFPKKMRSIRDLGKWKAHEKEIMLLHVGLPILRKFLPSEHFYHHALFVTGIKLLTDDVILEQDRQLAEALLDSYTRLMANLYLYSDHTYNPHSLGHLAQQVFNHGNLVLLSSFVFEGMIALLKRKFHGTRGIVPQILKNMGRAQNAKNEVCKCINRDDQPDKAKSFCDQLFTKSTNKERVTENIVFMKPLMSELPSSLRNIDLNQIGLDATTDRLTFAYQMEKSGESFHSDSYPYKRTSCSYFVCFRAGLNEESYGIVKCFVVKNNVPYAIVREFKNLNKNVCQMEELDDPKALLC